MFYIHLFSKGNCKQEIDSDHLKQVPTCGEIPKKVSSRITNAKDSDVHFPWVVRVQREFEAKEGVWIGMCGGTILNEK